MTKKMYIKKIIADFIFRLKQSFKEVATEDGFRVLNYHSIADGFIDGDSYQMTTPKQLFCEQMKFLHDNGYNVLPYDEVAERIVNAHALPENTVCITFDDGFKDNLTNALPALEKYGFKATIFLTANFISNGKEWLDWNDIGELLKSGTFSFGAHSLSHRKLYGLNENELKDEIGASKKILEDRLKMPITLFAYPFGSYGSFDKKAVGVVMREGYRAAFTTIAGWNRSGSDPYTIRRTRISWFDDNSEFEKELKGAYDWYRLWQLIQTTS